MITRRLVLVLGAGASMPFGFPSGRGLKTEITKQLKPSSNTPMLTNLIEVGFDPAFIEQFRSALQKSGKQSVDAFLEHRDEFRKVGKTAIACALMPLENEERLFTDEQPNWYEYFFSKLNARFEEFEKNSVSVLTFNYDRSLEHYLFTALRNAYGKPPEECAEQLLSLPIIHLYGQLGELPYLATEGIKFGAVINTENLKKCADGIQIIHDDVTNKPQFKRAHELLRNAERICFLGFGYDRVNLERLMAHGTNSSQEICGTAIGFTGRECFFIERQIKERGFERLYSLDFHSEDSLEFLRSQCVFDWE